MVTPVHRSIVFAVQLGGIVGLLAGVSLGVRAVQLERLQVATLPYRIITSASLGGINGLVVGAIFGLCVSLLVSRRAR